MIIHLVYKCLNRLRFHKGNAIQYLNKMIAQYNLEIIKVNVCSTIIFFITFFSSTLLAHPHQHNELSIHQHTHPNDVNDLNIQSTKLASQTNSKQNQTNKKLILVDDNLYL